MNIRLFKSVNLTEDSFFPHLSFPIPQKECFDSSEILLINGKLSFKTCKDNHPALASLKTHSIFFCRIYKYDS